MNPDRGALGVEGFRDRNNMYSRRTSYNFKCIEYRR